MDDKKLNNSDLPALFQVSDKTSIKAQNNYFLQLKSYLVLLLAAALSSSYLTGISYYALISVLLFLTSLAVLVWTFLKKPEEIWYNGRAVAESVKTRTWRWIMRAEPYGPDMSDKEVTEKFESDLKEILDNNISISAHLKWGKCKLTTVSENMKSIRNSPIEERLSIYKRERVEDQAEWYARKSDFNCDKAKKLFFISILLHSAAAVILLFSIKIDISSFLQAEVFATAAGAVLTWLQAKKHNELKSSYSLAANEIVLIKCEAEFVDSEKTLSDFVLSSESAFSREHTQWCARKNA